MKIHTERVFTVTWLSEGNKQVTKEHVLNEPDLCKYLFCLSFSILCQFIYETDLHFLMPVTELESFPTTHVLPLDGEVKRKVLSERSRSPLENYDVKVVPRLLTKV